MAAFELMSREDYQVSYAIGSDLTAWDNAQAALLVGELNACDWFYGGSVRHTKPKTVEVNPGTSAGHIPRRLTVGRDLGGFKPTFYLQTGIFTYAVMGLCVTTEATPNIHAISKRTTETPISIAFHLEKEGTTHQRRKEVMGMVPRSNDISVSEKSTIALQSLIWEHAYSTPGAASDLLQPTDLTQAIHNPYTWFHYKNPSGASEFKYNSNDVDISIMELDMHIGWAGSYLGEYDELSYFTNGLVVPPFDSYVTIGCKVNDASTAVLDTISDTAHGSYAGDLDFVADFYESATRYLKYTWDKMYLDPLSYEEVFQSENDWYDGVKFTLRFLDENSSLVVEEKNALDNDYYENP